MAKDALKMRARRMFSGGFASGPSRKAFCAERWTWLVVFTAELTDHETRTEYKNKAEQISAVKWDLASVTSRENNEFGTHQNHKIVELASAFCVKSTANSKPTVNIDYV